MGGVSASHKYGLPKIGSPQRVPLPQPDVLEMLVQAGADLNARTKNGETPYDICEDPDLKERILQLRSEMETKRAMQPNKLRRTQSQNTRSQSVRRTSIREKGMISRREAREEARIRQEQQAPLGKDEDEEAKRQTDVDTPDGDSSARTSPNSELERPGSAAGVAEPTLQFPNRCSLEAVALPDSPTSCLPPASPPSYSEVSSPPPTSSRGGGTAEAVKVEIHVTVNTTQQGAAAFSPQNGTLSDLKRHRADLRNNRGSLTLTAAQQQEVVSKMATSTAVGGQNGHHHFSATLPRASYEAPPSPSMSIRRFRSDPSEIVGEPQRKDCCTVM